MKRLPFVVACLDLTCLDLDEVASLVQKVVEVVEVVGHLADPIDLAVVHAQPSAVSY